MGMRPQGNEQEARRNKHVRSAPAKIAVKALGEDVLDGILDKSPNPLLLILDCVQDPHNLGAILRTADGAGVDAVIAPGGSIRDQESIDYCNANGMAMLFTGLRHFKH